MPSVQLAADLHILVYTGLLLLASQAGGRAATALGAPRLSGYLAVGLLLGPSISGVLERELVEQELGLIVEMALAVIAFSIGGSLSLPRLRRLGKPIVCITCTEALGAMLLVTAALLVVLPYTGDQDARPWNDVLALALVVGAVSTATAPAAILSIVHEYRARGPLTTVLFGVVALDDGLAVGLFAVAISLAGSLSLHEALTWQQAVLTPATDLLLAALIGVAVGMLLRITDRWISGPETMLGVVLGAILLAAGLAHTLHSSPLLACMVLGFVVVNLVAHHQDVFEAVDRVEEPLFGLFFAIAGAHLNLSLLATAGWLALVITAARFTGKLLGAYIGARISDAPPPVGRYLGLALLPQAGVIVGLILQASDVLPRSDFLEIVVSAVLAAVVVNELITPFLVRYALRAAGEVPQQQASARPSGAGHEEIQT